MVLQRATGGAFTPAHVEVIDLSLPVSGFEDATRDRIRALVRIGPHPVGIVELGDRPDAGEVETAIKEQLGPAIEITRTRSRLAADGLCPSEPGPTVAVMIATRDRPDELVTCLRTLATLRSVPDQLIVVDNAPTDGATRCAVQAWSHPRLPDVEYVYAARPGLANAHNAGLDQVRTDLVAFTDDDVLVDHHWLDQIVAGFANGDDVGAVTGMIHPAELETWAQQWAEDNIGFNKGFTPRRFDLGADRHPDPLFPYNAGVMGSGANMAFRTDVLRALGGFDPALGAGTPARGGDDLHALHSVVMAGRAVFYQPSAIVHHHHHRTVDGLQRQMAGYGTGLTAYLTSLLIARPGRSASLARRAISAAGWMQGSGNFGGADDESRALRNAQRRGMLEGPMAYLRSLRVNRR